MGLPASIAMLTREWPPEIYGGAGVHVSSLVAALQPLTDVDVHCFGADRSDAHGYGDNQLLSAADPAMQVLAVDLQMAAGVSATASLVHSHTWYANLAGQLAALRLGVPHVLTAHSLEPRRPWKAEQLGTGYALSCWVERTAHVGADAIIAVSGHMRADLLDCYPEVDAAKVHVIHNGIDPDLYSPDLNTNLIEELGVEPTQPYVIAVGRITRQKGFEHFLRAAAQLPPEVAVVMCASSPDTEQMRIDVEQAWLELQARHPRTLWLREHVPQPALRQLLSHAAAFVCPSIYEPLGIVNLEAMACATAVVASDVGGIPEVVDERNGVLVHYDANDAEFFERELAAAMLALATDSERATRLGAQGRQRVEAEFSWNSIARKTFDLYSSLT